MKANCVTPPEEFYVAKYPYTQGAQRVGEYFCISQKMRMGLDTKLSVGLSLLKAPRLLKSSSNIHFSCRLRVSG